MIFWRGRALYLYGTEKNIQRSQRKLREHSGFLKDDSNNFGEISGTQRNCQKGFSKINEVLMKPQSHFELSQGLFFNYGQTQQSHFGQYLSGFTLSWRLVISFVVFQMSTMSL